MLGIYCRISREKYRNEDQSIDVQKDLGIAYANNLGLSYRVYIDEGISAATTKKELRPCFIQMANDIQEGVITVLYAYDQSRLEREAGVWHWLVSILQKHNVKFHSKDGVFDPNNSTDKFVMGIMSQMNAYQVDLMKDKIQASLKKRAEKGKSHGVLPYGYMKGTDGLIKIDIVEADVVKSVYQMSLSGIGMRTIAELLQKERVPTRMNKIGKGTLTTKNKYTGLKTTRLKTEIEWSGNSVRGILTNTIYKGVRKFGGKEYKVPAIIDPFTWQSAQENLEKNQNNKGRKVQHNYLLKGLLRCGRCGSNYYGRTRVNLKDHYYMCSSKRYKDKNCGNRSINIGFFEDFIWYRLFCNGYIEELYTKYYQSPTEKIKEKEEDLQSAKKQLEKIKDSKTSLFMLVADGKVERSEIDPALHKIRKKENLVSSDIENLEYQLGELHSIVENDEGVRHKFKDLSGTLNSVEKKKILWECIRNIVIHYHEGENNVLDDKVKYGFFTIQIEYKIPIEPETFMNGYLNDLQTWYRISDENKIDELPVVGFNRLNPLTEPHPNYPELALGTSYVLDKTNGEILLDSIIPRGGDTENGHSQFSQDWDMEELIKYYGTSKFKRLVSEQMAKNQYLGYEIDSLFY